MQGILQARYYNLGDGHVGKYLVQAWLQAKSSGIKLPEVHGIGKGLDPNLQPERQVIKPIVDTKRKEISQMTPWIGQGRTGLRHKIKTLIPTNKPIAQTMDKPTKSCISKST